MIRVDITGADIRRALRDLAERVTDRRQLMADIAGVLLSGAEQNFEEEGRPRWPALAESTLAQRQKSRYDGGILQRTGALADSVQAESDNDTAIVGSGLRYARIHQLGGKAATIPARPYLGIDRAEEEEILDLIEQRLMGD